jgi:uroporphyrinogen decarboxylase
MNSRERVLAALNHQEPDRVPVDFGGHRSSGIMAMAYAWLKRRLGISTGDIYVYDMVQQLAIVEEPVLDALDIDVVEMGRGFMQDDAAWKDWVLPDGTPCKIPAFVNVERRGEDWYLLGPDGRELGIQKKDCLYFEQIYFPLLERGIQDDDFADLPDRLGETIWTGVATPGGHLPFDEQGLSQLADGARRFRESTERAVIGLFGGNMFEIPQFLYRIDHYLMYLAMYPEQIHRLSEKLCEIHLANLEKWLGAVGPYIDVILFGDDLGSQNGPMISPEMYREFVKPYHRRLWNRAKELANAKVMLHSCGGIEPLLSDMIEAGLDATNPVQITAKGMNAAHLKDRYGGKLTFWGGGCDTRDVLPNGTADQITRHVEEQIRIFSPGGGFVFQQVHNIMANVPPENVVTMFRTAHRRPVAT